MNGPMIARVGIPLALCVLAGCVSVSLDQDAPAATAHAAFDNAGALRVLRERIRGREQQPARTVFDNVSVYGALPAERLLMIMDMGMSRSLGVSCTHCHDPDDWAADTLRPKRAARGMVRMTQTLNQQLLRSVEELDTAQPTVNCTTCHRGERVPALQLPGGGTARAGARGAKSSN